MPKQSKLEWKKLGLENLQPKTCDSNYKLSWTRKKDWLEDTKWMKSGDEMNKFFPLLNQGAAGGRFYCDEDDTVVSSNANLTRDCSFFYSKLYIAKLVLSRMSGRRKFQQNCLVMSHVNSHLVLKRYWRILCW